MSRFTGCITLLTIRLSCGMRCLPKKTTHFLSAYSFEYRCPVFFPSPSPHLPNPCSLLFSRCRESPLSSRHGRACGGADLNQRAGGRSLGAGVFTNALLWRAVSKPPTSYPPGFDPPMLSP